MSSSVHERPRLLWLGFLWPRGCRELFTKLALVPPRVSRAASAWVMNSGRRWRRPRRPSPRRGGHISAVVLL